MGRYRIRISYTVDHEYHGLTDEQIADKCLKEVVLKSEVDDPVVESVEFLGGPSRELGVKEDIDDV